MTTPAGNAGLRVRKEGFLYQLTFFRQSLSVNCYLVEEDETLTLIDTAIPGSAAGILEAARQIGKPIARIVLTHGHHDHVGALDQLKQALPDAAVYVSRREARLLAGDKTAEPGEPDSPVRGNFTAGLSGLFEVLLQDGDEIGSLLVIAAPGHTPGSVALLDTRTRALIAGDALQTEGGIAVAGQVVPAFPFPAQGTWNPQVALESARKLRGYQSSLLAVGHGEMVTSPAAQLDLAIAEAEATLG